MDLFYLLFRQKVKHFSQDMQEKNVPLININSLILMLCSHIVLFICDILFLPFGKHQSQIFVTQGNKFISTVVKGAKVAEW